MPTSQAQVVHALIARQDVQVLLLTAVPATLATVHQESSCSHTAEMKTGTDTVMEMTASKLRANRLGMLIIRMTAMTMIIRCTMEHRALIVMDVKGKLIRIATARLLQE